ncbi:MAG: hypothetical protein ABFS86_10775 [Planctomycetota bacterium]
MDRVTVTMPAGVIREIDRFEKNRSRFILEAVRRELELRRLEELKRSLRQPHPETGDIVAEGFEEWAADLPAEDADGLVDMEAGVPIRWVSETGWVEEDR